MTTAMARSDSSIPRKRRYERAAGNHNDAHTSRTASKISSGVWTPRNDRYWPANDAELISSAVADERIASVPLGATSSASFRISRPSCSGIGAVRNSSSMRRISASNRSGVGSGRARTSFNDSDSSDAATKLR